MSDDTTDIDIDLSTDLEELDDDELRQHYIDLDDLVGHGAGLSSDHEHHGTLHTRYMRAWKELENRAEDYEECPECGEKHWRFEHGDGPAHCANCGHMGGEETQIAVHEAANRLLEGGA